MATSSPVACEGGWVVDRLRVSVVIPTYGRCASARRALETLALQSLPASCYEVIVAIDGSEDGTREMVEAFPAPYSLRAHWQPNRGRAAACNAGIALAQGEVVVLLDDDMEPVPQFLEAHLDAHPAGSRRGVLGAVPIPLDASSPPVTRYIGEKFNAHLQKLSRPGHVINFREFYSGNFSIRRDVLLAVGTFDEAFKLYGNEDGELALRLQQAGVELSYSPEVLAIQHYTKDFRGLARDNWGKGQTAVLLARKYPTTFYDLKLGTYHQGSRKWRVLRGALLALSQVWTGLPDALTRAVMLVERSGSPRLPLVYGLALDYFYWLGVRAATRSAPDGGT